MNKFMVRLFAVVLSVMMLGTVAFAGTAEITEGTDTTIDGTIAADKAEAYEAQTVKTVMAYIADSADDTTYTADDIIALDQAADVASIKIDADKVENANYVVVLYGGDGEITDKAVINLTGLVEFDVIECATEITLVDGPYTKKYTNVAVAKHNFTIDSSKTVTEYGVKWIKDGVESANQTVADADTLIDGEGGVQFGVVMYNIPDDVVITAKPFVQYAK